MNLLLMIVNQMKIEILNQKIIVGLYLKIQKWEKNKNIR